MALDEPRDTDHVYDVENFKYIVDKSFMETAKPIMVDFMQMGFKITSGLQINAEAGGCSGCGSTSSCC